MSSVDLPPLTNLSVYQETYCDQELTDRLCRYVWDNKPEFVCRMAEQKLLPFPQNHDDIHAKACGRVEYYLWDEIKAGRVPELSMLAMIDFMYEIDRRVRKGLGLPDIPVVGTPLSPSPDGPFPELIARPFYKPYTDYVFPGAQQEMVNKYAPLIYQDDLNLMYAHGEQARRFMRAIAQVSLLLVSLKKMVEIFVPPS